MTCEVKVIEDSINPYNGIRLTTMQLRYWRAIHAETLTHRQFSRCASSSRAVPLKTTIKNIWNDPAGPTYWGKNKPGMQASEELTGFDKTIAQGMWKASSLLMCSLAWTMDKVVSPHKQVINRLLEPWQYISVIVTATEWDNFYNLRIHPAAQPEMQELARAMKAAQDASIPTERLMHLPYITQEEREILTPEEAFKVSTARCARVSYLKHDGSKPSLEEDMKLYQRLVGSQPIHASPSENCAWAVDFEGFIKNFKGWEQHRVTVEESLND